MNNILKLEEALLHMNRKRSIQGKEPLTRAELAERVFTNLSTGIAAQYWSHLKAGRRMSALEPRHIVKICQITGVSADYLLGLSTQISGNDEQ